MWLSKKNIKKGVRQGFSSEAPFHWTKDLCAKEGVSLSTDFELSRILTWAPKRGEFPSSIIYLPHLCNDLARGMFSLWSHSDSAKNQWAGLSAVLPLLSASHRGFPHELRRSLPCVGRKACAQKDGLHWVQTWTPWNTNVGTKKASKTAQPPLISEIIQQGCKFSAMTMMLDIEYFPKQSGMAKKMAQSKFPTAL